MTDYADPFALSAADEDLFSLPGAVVKTTDSETDADSHLRTDLQAEDIEAVAEAEITSVLAGFKDRARKEEARFIDAVDTEHWVCLCFQTREQKEEWLRKTGLAELGDKYLDGMRVADEMGITLTSPVPPMPKLRIDKRFEDLMGN